MDGLAEMFAFIFMGSPAGKKRDNVLLGSLQGSWEC